jgi:glycosyltransferase involved in cell wall biosynthesis
MRICHVIESSSGGSSQIVIDLLRRGVAAGDEQTLIYSPLRAEPRFIQSLQSLRGKIEVQTLDMQRLVGWRDIVAASKLLFLIRRLGPFDVVNAHSSKAGAIARKAGVFLPGVRQVYTPHAFITMAPGAPRIYSLIEWLASWFCDAVVVGSQQEWDHARGDLHISTSRLHLIPMGIDLDIRADRGAARRRLEAEEGDFLVGFVGRLVAQKNPERLAEAFARVAAEAPSARLMVVGEGHLREELKAHLDRRGVEKRVRLLGGRDARVLMPGFDCLVCTSDYESYGLVFPEALAAGVPLVTPPVGVALEAVIEGETGFLTSFEPADIAAAVLKLMALDAPTRARMAERCREHARRFDFAETAGRMRALYQSLVRKSSTSEP